MRQGPTQALRAFLRDGFNCISASKTPGAHGRESFASPSLTGRRIDALVRRTSECCLERIDIKRRKFSLSIGVTFALGLAVASAAPVTNLTQLTAIGSGPTLVTYWQYKASDCPDEAACRYTGTINTGASSAYETAVPVIAGFELMLAKPDGIGPIAVRVSGQRGPNKPGDVDLQISAQLRNAGNKSFSYSVTIAVIETFPSEGWRLTTSGAACSKGQCPVALNFAAQGGAVPNDYWLVGIALQMFDSDRSPGPLWGAYAVPTKINRDPATGNLTSELHCGTAGSPHLAPATLTGACETKWVAIAARANTDTVLPIHAGPPGAFPGPLTYFTSQGPSPSSAVIPQTCPTASSRPTRGYLDALGGFALFTGSNRITVQELPGVTPNMSAFSPLPGMVSNLTATATQFTFSPGGAMHTHYGMALTSAQGKPPLPAPLTAARWSVMVCL